MVRPPLRHVHSLLPMGAAVIGSANDVLVLVRQRALDRVGRPFAGFVKQRAGHGAEAVGGHLIAGETQPAQRGVDRVFRHWRFRRPDRRENEARMPRNDLCLLQDLNGLPAQRHNMLHAPLHLGGGNAPD